MVTLASLRRITGIVAVLVAALSVPACALVPNESKGGTTAPDGAAPGAPDPDTDAGADSGPSSVEQHQTPIFDAFDERRQWLR
jgi:hypothetical protein